MKKPSLVKNFSINSILGRIMYAWCIIFLFRVIFSIADVVTAFIRSIEDESLDGDALAVLAGSKIIKYDFRPSVNELLNRWTTLLTGVSLILES